MHKGHFSDIFVKFIKIKGKLGYNRRFLVFRIEKIIFVLKIVFAIDRRKKS
jgi:hypothetical protein